MMRLLTLTAAVLTLALALAGCGQKGPLYLPQPDAPASEEAAQ